MVKQGSISETDKIEINEQRLLTDNSSEKK